MSEEFETDQVQSDKEANFAALRAEREALEAELRPLKVEKAVRDAGFDPATPEGKALSKLLGSDATGEKARELAADIGWEPPQPRRELTPEERVTLAGADKIAALNASSTSDAPPNFDDLVRDAEARLKAAKNQGNTFEAQQATQEIMQLNNQLLTQQMAQKARS